MAQFKCLKPSTNGRRGEVITMNDSHRTKQLVQMGIIAPMDKPAEKKGGKKPKDAEPKAKVETKKVD